MLAFDMKMTQSERVYCWNICHREYNGVIGLKVGSLYLSLSLNLRVSVSVVYSNSLREIHVICLQLIYV